MSTTEGTINSKSLPAWTLFEEKCRTMTHDQLAPYLQHKNSDTRITAAMEFGRRGTDKVRKYALALCKEKEWRLRDSGAIILKDLNITAAKKRFEIISVFLTLAETDPQIRVRVSAFCGIREYIRRGWIQPTTVLPLFQKTAKSRAARMRLAVAMSLPLHCPKDVPLIQLLLQDSDALVRNWAAFSVKRLQQGHPDVLDSLAHMLVKEEDIQAKREAIVSLAKFHDVRAIPALKIALQMDGEHLFDLLEAVDDLALPELIPELEQLLERVKNTPLLDGGVNNSRVHLVARQ